MLINMAGLNEALGILGQLLEDRGLHFEIVAIGGGSLLLLGLVERTTRDLDLVALICEKELISACPLPTALLEAVETVAKILNLNKDWLNIGPASLLETGLPPGFVKRLHVKKYKGLSVYLADRLDQISFKLYASVDQGPDSKHFYDLIALKPSLDELEQAKDWCLTQDISIGFENELRATLQVVHAHK